MWALAKFHSNICFNIFLHIIYIYIFPKYNFKMFRRNFKSTKILQFGGQTETPFETNFSTLISVKGSSFFLCFHFSFFFFFFLNGNLYYSRALWYKRITPRSSKGNPKGLFSNKGKKLLGTPSLWIQFETLLPVLY